MCDDLKRIVWNWLKTKYATAKGISQVCLPSDFRETMKIGAAYISAFNTVSTQSSNSANNALGGRFNVDREFPNATVEGISNDILWNCRSASPSRNYFRYMFALLLAVAVFAFVVTIKLPSKLTAPKQWLRFFTSVLLRVNLLIILLSYDIGAWQCFEGPARINFNSTTGYVDLEGDMLPKRFQRYGSIVASLFLVIGSGVALYVNYVTANEDTVSEYQIEVQYHDETETEFQAVKILEPKDTSKWEIASRLYTHGSTRRVTIGINEE